MFPGPKTQTGEQILNQPSHNLPRVWSWKYNGGGRARCALCSHGCLREGISIQDPREAHSCLWLLSPGLPGAGILPLAALACNNRGSIPQLSPEPLLGN